MKTFWLSFADEGGFRGACVIDVDAAEAEQQKPELRAKFPKHRPGAEWLAAAARKAWLYGCNPGGQILCAEMPPDTAVPRNRLLTPAELWQWGQEKTTH